MKILVVGLGYVGLVTAICLAEKGNNVIGYDNNVSKIEMLKKNEQFIYEKSLKELMIKNKDKIIYTGDKKSAYKDADVIFICVNTPENKNGSANLKNVYSVVDDIIKYTNKKCLVVTKSTVPIGVNCEIEKYIRENVDEKDRIEVASNPEFLSQGTAIKDTLKAKRIVIGTNSEWAKNVLTDIYKNFENTNFIFTDRNTAEIIKYASNVFLALKISYINEIADLCDNFNADIETVKIGMGLDDRIGEKFLEAGIGFGGSCLPKDIKALYYQGKQNEIDLKTVKAAMEVNKKQRNKLVQKINKYYPSLKGINIAVLGLAFKPGTDDIRESQSIQNIEYFSKNGANIKVWDSIVKMHFKLENVKQYCTIDETIKDADICLIFTEWKEIKEYNVKNYSKLMNKAIILDGRNCYKLENVKEENIIYDSIGRKTVGKLIGGEV